jgi:multiple sugar transport system permease protein
MAIPIGVAIYLSLTQWSGRGTPRWVGFQNYVHLFSDPTFWQAVKVTALYAVIFIPLNIVIGFSLALLLNQRARGITVFRAIFFLPSILTGVAVAMLWQFMFSTDFGILNSLLAWLQLPKVPWLTSANWVIPSIALMQLWGVGGSMVVYLGGLQGVPTELYEQARVDGAGFWHSLRHVTLPMMTPVIFFQLILGVIGTFQVFTQPYIMTQGGPNLGSYFYSIDIYVTAFQHLQFGYASALAVVLFVFMLLVTLILFRTSRNWVFYAGTRG